MDFINEIKHETLIICNNSDKEKILEMNKFINIKMMTMNEFIKMYCFDYDETTILYIIKKYHVKYEIAHEYIDNLYYISKDKYNINKLDFLSKLKNELNTNGLLIYNYAFREYVKNIDIIIYNIRLDKFHVELFNCLKYKLVSYDYKKYEHDVLKFQTMEEEVEYVACRIGDLISNDINIKNIKLTNIDSSYYNTIIRIFDLFNLKVNIKNQTPLTAYPIIKKFNSLYKDYSIEECLDKIDHNDQIYNNLIEIINKYIKYDNKELIMYKLEHTYITSINYDNGIDIIDYLIDIPSDEDYVFMMGFNDSLIPKSYKDIDYITDNIKKYVNLDKTCVKNELLRQDILRNIYNIKNLTITYKLRDTKQSYYQSTLCEYFNIVDGITSYKTSYSEIYNKIKLTRYIDDYIKYGNKDYNLDILYNNFKTKYNSYNNKFSGIERKHDKLLLSYSKMQLYNKCAFRYYLSCILKLDIFEENFATIIGSMVHFVMEKCLSNNDDDINKYANIFLENKVFSKKEKFFLDKYISSLKDLLEVAKLLKESKLDLAMYEKEINIPYSDNVNFVGIIDKIIYCREPSQTTIALIDYKTGNDDISLKYLKYGLNIQLPIYLYLSTYLDLKNVVYAGFYLQRFNINDSDYRLIGYSNSNKEILSSLDKDYDNSKIIKGMKTLKDGSFSKNSKVLTNEEINTIKDITKDKIEEVINNIKNNRFDINPKALSDKVLGCEYCKFKDICFKKYEDLIFIKPDELEGDE